MLQAAALNGFEFDFSPFVYDGLITANASSNGVVSNQGSEISL